MGGYGALRFSFAYPELFSSVSAQSAALIAESPRQTARMPTPLSGLLGAIFGDPIDLPEEGEARDWEEAVSDRKRAAVYGRVSTNMSALPLLPVSKMT